MPSSSPQEMISFKACTADADAQSQTVQCMCISEDTGCVQPQSAEACTCSMCNCHHPLTTSAEKPSVAHTAPSHDSQATKSRLFQANTNKPELVCSHLSSQHSGCLQANGSQKCTPTPPRPSNATPPNDCALPNTPHNHSSMFAQAMVHHICHSSSQLVATSLRTACAEAQGTQKASLQSENELKV